MYINKFFQGVFKFFCLSPKPKNIINKNILYFVSCPHIEIRLTQGPLLFANCYNTLLLANYFKCLAIHFSYFS